jgi:DNA-directed RNA polymerase subunit RPC12/RpoP
MSDLLAKCSVCHALLDEEDLFCSNCGTESPQSDRKGPPPARSFTHKFTCAGCGASMSYDASAGQLRCPFCGSGDLVEERDAKEIAPKRVVVFAIEHERAISLMRAWLGNGFWRPGDLAQQAAVVGMTAVYVPYWIFEATTHTYWTADTSQTPAGARGDWYPLTGEHHGRYAGVLIGASGALTPAETSALCPFDLAEAVEPAEVDLDNVTVEQFSLARKYARPMARQGLETMECQACQAAYVPGRARNVKVNVRIEGLASEAVLLPVWVMAYRYADEIYRFLVNGATGKAHGRAPTSWRKIAAVVGIGVGILVVILIVVALAGR